MPQTQDQLNFTSRLHKRFKKFDKRQRDIWESLQLIEFYTPKLHFFLKRDTLTPVEYAPLWDEKRRRKSKKDTIGALQSLKTKYNTRRSLLEAVLVYEDYIIDLVESSFLFFPDRLLNTDEQSLSEQLLTEVVNDKCLLSLQNKIENSTFNVNDTKKLDSLKTWIRESQTYEQLLGSIISSRLLKIFHGRPSLILTTNKTKMWIDEDLRSNHQDLINKLELIVGVRNILSHNDGKVSRKFIENVDPAAVEGEAYDITIDFLKTSIKTVCKLAAYATSYFIQRNLGGTIEGRLSTVVNKRM